MEHHYHNIFNKKAIEGLVNPMYVVIGIGFLVGIMLLFKWRLNEFKGEEAFEVYLETLKLEGHLFENIMLDNQTMARYLYVTNQGIFNLYYNPEVLGRIYGDDEESTWNQVLEHRKLPIPNPVRLMEKQRYEFEKIGDRLGCIIPVYEYICLSKRAVSKLNISIPIVALDDLVEVVRAKENLLSDGEVREVVKWLRDLSEA